jgi:secreted PhoX family phosphatase
MQHPGLTEKAPYDRPESRFPDYRGDVPPRASVVVVYRDDGGKIGT